LLVLVITISAGSLFGMIGLVLSAPLVSAALHITRDVGRIRAAAVQPAAGAPAPPPVPT
jgi:predicted PurR-regulated permease PerM